MNNEIASVLGGIGDICIAAAAIVVQRKNIHRDFMPDDARRWLNYGIAIYVLCGLPRFFVGGAP